MTPSPQLPGLLALLALILTTARALPQPQPQSNRVQQPANHGLMTSTAPHGGVCTDNDGGGSGDNTTTTTTTTTRRRRAEEEAEEEEEEEEEETHTARVPEGVFAAFGPKNASNPLCGRAVHVAWADAGGRRRTDEAVLVGYCDKCWGTVVGGIDVSPGLFREAGGSGDTGTVGVDWWVD